MRRGGAEMQRKLAQSTQAEAEHEKTALEKHTRVVRAGSAAEPLGGERGGGEGAARGAARGLRRGAASAGCGARRAGDLA